MFQVQKSLHAWVKGHLHGYNHIFVTKSYTHVGQEVFSIINTCLESVLLLKCLVERLKPKQL